MKVGFPGMYDDVLYLQSVNIQHTRTVSKLTMREGL